MPPTSGEGPDATGRSGSAARPSAVRRSPSAVRRPSASPDDFVGFFRANYGPVHTAFEALDEPGRRRLHDDLAALAAKHDRAQGPSVALPSEYLETVAVRA
jgi:hypothetical protein